MTGSRGSHNQARRAGGRDAALAGNQRTGDDGAGTRSCRRSARVSDRRRLGADRRGRLPAA